MLFQQLSGFSMALNQYLASINLDKTNNFQKQKRPLDSGLCISNQNNNYPNASQPCSLTMRLLDAGYSTNNFLARVGR